MSDETFQELQWAEEQQNQDNESSRVLTERHEVIALKCKDAQEWIQINKKKINEH